MPHHGNSGHDQLKHRPSKIPKTLSEVDDSWVISFQNTQELFCAMSPMVQMFGALQTLSDRQSPIGSLMPPLLEQGHTEEEVPRTVLLSENLR